MSDSDPDAPTIDWVDTTAGDDPHRSGGTGDAGRTEPASEVGGDVEDIDTGTGATTAFASEDAMARNRQQGADRG
jgi:hypothetical protein